MLLGAHMSVAGGVSKALERAQSIDTNTTQIFTKNQNSVGAKAHAARRDRALV